MAIVVAAYRILCVALVIVLFAHHKNRVCSLLIIKNCKTNIPIYIRIKNQNKNPIGTDDEMKEKVLLVYYLESH